MPPLSAAPRRVFNSLSLQFFDWRGKPYTSTGFRSAVSTPAQVAAVNATLGSMSNARAMNFYTKDGEEQINPANALNTAFDEAYSTVDDLLVMVFQNDTGAVEEWAVPAPDAIFFASDGETVVTPDSAAAAGSGAELLDNAIVAILAMMGGTFAFARAYKNKSGRRSRQPLPLAEPTGNPGDAPGL